MDLARPQAAEELFSECEARSWRVDALVNNAGTGSFGFFSETDLLLESKLLELNVVSLTKLTKLFLKPMIARGGGYILNVASTAAFQPGPLMAVYYASKAYVLSFSEALADEVARAHVFVTALCPGATRTGFWETANMQSPKLFKNHSMDAADVAAQGYDGMIRGKRIVVPGFLNKVMAASVRFVPRSFVTRVVRKIQEADKASRQP
jgi:short-subunit dehydrogenase